MRKLTGIIVSFIAIAMLAVCCSKDGAEADADVKVSIRGLMPEFVCEEGTKSYLVNTVRVSWEAGTKVYAFDGSKCIGALDVSLDGGDDRYALLTAKSGEIDLPAQACNLVLVCGTGFSMDKGAAISGGAVKIDLSVQNEKKPPFVVYATISYDGSSSIQEEFVPFKFASSVVRTNCLGMEASQTISQATVKNVNTVCVLTMDNGNVTVGGDTPGTITRTNAEGFKIDAKGTTTFSVATLITEAGSERSIHVKANDKKYTSAFTKGGKLKANTSYNTICKLGIEIDPPHKRIDGHDAVQLWEGGPYWATCNIGAKEPEEAGYQAYVQWYGDCFMWGAHETAYNGQLDWSNKTFSFKTSKPSDIYGSWDSSKGFSGTNAPYYINKEYTKYKDNSSNAPLLPEDDIATIMWGQHWRMPTSNDENSDFYKLMSQCYWVEVMPGMFGGKYNNGYKNSMIYGYAVFKRKPEDKTARTIGNWRTPPTPSSVTYEVDVDDHIFLPDAGYARSTSLQVQSKQAYYWSASQYNGDCSYADNLYFSQGVLGIGQYRNDSATPYRKMERYTGMVVRAVSDGD